MYNGLNHSQRSSIAARPGTDLEQPELDAARPGIEREDGVRHHPAS